VIIRGTPKEHMTVRFSQGAGVSHTAGSVARWQLALSAADNFQRRQLESRCLGARGRAKLSSWPSGSWMWK
jgi:hypothetical protein